MKNSHKDNYRIARDKYARIGVDADDAVRKLTDKSISLHCWQGDDVRGFENTGPMTIGGGLRVTGDFPGKARTVAELRLDMEKALSLIPGTHRVNLHAMYGEFGDKKIERNDFDNEHFAGWIAWARGRKLMLDFNATLFAHPRAASGFTLSSKDRSTRNFWIEHVKKCRKIAAFFGRTLGGPSIHNLWIPDGMKDFCVDRMGYRSILSASLDQIYRTRYPGRLIKDSVESKLFGIGSESFVAGSHEFYLGYAIKHDLMPCLDLGHFHPTESIADKISSILLHTRELLLHISRGVRWDSDHVAVYDDQLREVMQEIVRSDALNRVHIALDYFDASLNRIGAWVIGARAAQKALLYALLEPTRQLRESEDNMRYFERLALLERQKTMPLQTVWDQCCLINDTIPDDHLVRTLANHEHFVLSRRE